MTAYILFFGSLLGLSGFFALKLVEVRRGTKPFSAARYQADLFLKKQSETILRMFRYVNVQTAKLLVLFILSEISAVFTKLIARFEDSKWGKMMKGQHMPDSNGNTTRSTFLKDMGEALKGDKKPPSK